MSNTTQLLPAMKELKAIRKKVKSLCALAWSTNQKVGEKDLMEIEIMVNRLIQIAR